MSELWNSRLQRRLEAGRLNRRDFLSRAALLGLALPTVGTLLAACGGEDEDDDGDDPTATSAAPAEATATQQISVIVPTPTPITAATQAATEAATAAATTAAATATAPAGAGPTRGGRAVFLREGDASNGTYDPVLSDDNDVIWVIFSVYETLVRPNPESTGIDPGLAEAWEITEDAMTATFHLREGLKFSDGSDVTTDDIIFSLERARDSEGSPWTFTLAQAQEITAPDDATIVVNLSEPYVPFFAGMAMFNAGIISKPFFEANAQESDPAFGGLAITTGVSGGAGPYEITTWDVSERTVLTRNEHYWNKDKAFLDEIELRTVPDSNSMILQLQGGDVDGVIGQLAIPYNRVAELQGDPNLQVVITPAAQNYFCQINVAYRGPDVPYEGRPPFDDLNFRNALKHAVDYQTLIDTVQFGIAEPSNSILPRGAMFWNPDQVSHEFDLDKAREFLAQSSSPDGGEGEVLINTGNAQMEAIATQLKAMWAEINFNLIITPLDAAAAADRRRAGDYDFRLGPWTNDMIDPDQILSFYVQSEASNHGQTGYLDEEAAALVSEARVETDEERRRELYYEIQERWLDGPTIYLFNSPYAVAIGSHIKGYHQNPLGPWYFEDMYIEE